MSAATRCQGSSIGFHCIVAYCLTVPRVKPPEKHNLPSSSSSNRSSLLTSGEFSQMHRYNCLSTTFVWKSPGPSSRPFVFIPKNFVEYLSFLDHQYGVVKNVEIERSILVNASV
ncbi:hypothetical protein OPV22_002755 [Ensete ventricosum]|uniref:Uncharacterized protein n=1 Tax=Ensete ventricosum TaxID=4639 RepID=A0AAV8RYX1_ENSVE|nr:hypothetical protein OPV22_002755 [Ensete ventricosum]